MSTILGLFIAAIAATGGLGAWRAARLLAQIEQQRRHSELRPEFEITCVAGGMADLRIILRGPPALSGLDEVVVRILDERWVDHGARLRPGGPSAEEIAKHVWGPWEFNPGTEVADNRTSLPRPYSRETGKDWDRLSLVPSGLPYWATGLNQDQWFRLHDGQPVRLLISCRLGEQRWDLSYDVQAGPLPGATPGTPAGLRR